MSINEPVYQHMKAEHVNGTHRMAGVVSQGQRREGWDEVWGGSKLRGHMKESRTRKRGAGVYLI